MNRPIDNAPALDVWIDGDCSLCRTSRRWCELRDLDGRIRFIDFRTERELPLSRSDHEATIWVRGHDGFLLRGYAAWRRIVAELPRWRWLADAASLPPFTVIGQLVYRLVATNRARLSR